MIKEKITLQQLGMAFKESRSEKDFTKIYKRLKPSISYYLRDLVPDLDDRNEVIAITFSKVWRKIDQYDSFWNFSTWVHRIARNESLLMYRDRKNTYSYEGLEENGVNLEKKLITVPTSVEQQSPIDILYQKAIQEIQNLPDIYKTVLTLREIENKKYEEISEFLGWNHNTVRTRIRKGRELIRERLLKNEKDLINKYQEI